jgi:hypothetical protein
MCMYLDKKKTVNHTTEFFEVQNFANKIFQILIFSPIHLQLKHLFQVWDSS